MENPVLKSRLSIAYILSIFIYFVISFGIFFILKHEYGVTGMWIGSVFIMLYFLFVGNFMRNARTLYFFNDHMLIRYLFTGKKFNIPYREISEAARVRDLAEDTAVSTANPLLTVREPGNILITDDRILMRTSSGLDILITEMMFDNYMRIAAFIKEHMIRFQ